MLPQMFVMSQRIDSFLSTCQAPFSWLQTAIHV